MPRYPDVVDDDWFPVIKRGFRLRCCSCGLIHTIDFRESKNGQEIRIKRHEAATKAARRALHRKVVIVDE